MALFSDLSAERADFDAQRALSLPLGVMSPLWFAYASATSAGVAYWWLTRWTQPANLEGFDWFAAKTDPAPELLALPGAVGESPLETPVAAALEPVTSAADAVVETFTEAAAPATALVEQATSETLETTAAVIDDLTRIVGIGPRLADRLNELGVKSFRDLAAWSEEDLAKFDRDLDLKGRAIRDAWIAQARRFTEA